jgi:small subunit ribosomal protein S5
MGFSVLVVVGDKKGRVGVGLGKAADVLSAIRKGVKKAKRKFLTVPMNGTTIPFPIQVKVGAAEILLKPAPRGSGVIAGGPIRSVIEAAGIRDISSKIKGTSNKASNVYATVEALRQIQVLVAHKGITLKSVAEVEEAEKLKAKALDTAKKTEKIEDKKVETAKPEEKKVKKVIKKKEAK